MKNKILTLLLVVLALATLVFTSCSDVETDFEMETSTIPAITLHLYGLKEDGTNDDAVKLVEEQINRITEDKYKTSVKLHLLLEEEYDKVIEDAFVSVEEQAERTALAERAATAAAKAARLAAQKLPLEMQKEKKRAQREYEDWGEKRGMSMEEISVTMSDDVQLDIFLVNNRERLEELADREKIADISSPLTGAHSIITKYVSPLILSVAKINGMYYGVPTNKMLGTGEYEGSFYAFRTDLLEKYPLEIPTESSMTLNSLDKWLDAVDKNENCAVFFAPPSVIQNFDYYNDDMDSFPAYGTKNMDARSTNSIELEFTFDIGSGQNSGVAFTHFKRMAKYRNAGYFAPEGSNPATTDFAVGVFKGNLDEVKAQLGDRADLYSYYTYSAPKTTTKDSFGSTFVVSASCKYVSRAVELISGFFTDEDLRNLITYGIEGMHYEVNLDGKTIKMIENPIHQVLEERENEEGEMRKVLVDYPVPYNMGFETYGNTFIGYIPEELGADYQKKAIERNKNIKASAFIGFAEKVEDVDQKAFDKINKIAGDYIYDLMNGAKNVDEVLEEAMTRMGKYEDKDKLYPKENTGDEYTPLYNILLESLNGSFSYFSETRPGGSEKVDNNIITSEEKRRREEEAAKLEAEKAEEVTEEVTEETAE